MSQIQYIYNSKAPYFILIYNTHNSRSFVFYVFYFSKLLQIAPGWQYNQIVNCFIYIVFDDKFVK